MGSYAPNVRFVQPVVLVIGVGMYVSVLFLTDFRQSFSPFGAVPWISVAAAWNALLLAAWIIAIVDAIRRLRAQQTRQLATDALVVKLVSIPFFLLNFVAVAWLYLGGAVGLVFADPFVLPAAVTGSVLSYLAMLSTSVYGWAAIAQLRREHIIGTGLTVLYTILSFLFVTDIVAGVMLFGHSRRRPRVATIVLLVAAGLATVGLAVLAHFGTLYVDNVDYIRGPGLSPPDPLLTAWVTVGVVGVGVILATVIFALANRSTLRTEAQQTKPKVEASTESDAPDQVLAG